MKKFIVLFFSLFLSINSMDKRVDFTERPSVLDSDLEPADEPTEPAVSASVESLLGKRLSTAIAGLGQAKRSEVSKITRDEVLKRIDAIDTGKIMVSRLDEEREFFLEYFDNVSKVPNPFASTYGDHDYSLSKSALLSAFRNLQMGSFLHSQNDIGDKIYWSTLESLIADYFRLKNNVPRLKALMASRASLFVKCGSSKAARRKFIEIVFKQSKSDEFEIKYLCLVSYLISGCLEIKKLPKEYALSSIANYFYKKIKSRLPNFIMTFDNYKKFLEAQIRNQLDKDISGLIKEKLVSSEVSKKIKGFKRGDENQILDYFKDLDITQVKKEFINYYGFQTVDVLYYAACSKRKDICELILSKSLKLPPNIFHTTVLIPGLDFFKLLVDYGFNFFEDMVFCRTSPQALRVQPLSFAIQNKREDIACEIIRIASENMNDEAFAKYIEGVRLPAPDFGVVSWAFRLNKFAALNCMVKKGFLQDILFKRQFIVNFQYEFINMLTPEQIKGLNSECSFNARFFQKLFNSCSIDKFKELISEGVKINNNESQGVEFDIYELLVYLRDNNCLDLKHVQDSFYGNNRKCSYAGEGSFLIAIKAKDMELFDYLCENMSFRNSTISHNEVIQVLNYLYSAGDWLRIRKYLIFSKYVPEDFNSLDDKFYIDGIKNKCFNKKFILWLICSKLDLVKSDYSFVNNVKFKIDDLLKFMDLNNKDVFDFILSNLNFKSKLNSVSLLSEEDLASLFNGFKNDCFLKVIDKAISQDVDILKLRGEYLLKLAYNKGNEKLVKYLLDKGVNAQSLDLSGNSSTLADINLKQKLRKLVEEHLEKMSNAS